MEAEERREKLTEAARASGAGKRGNRVRLVCGTTSMYTGLDGLLHTDGYGVYRCKLPPEITAPGCWAHMRRKFTDTLKSLPKDLRGRSSAKTGLDYCNKLFHVEGGFAEQKLSFDERYQARLEQSKPVAEKFFAWARAEHEKIPCQKVCLVRRWLMP